MQNQSHPSGRLWFFFLVRFLFKTTQAFFRFWAAPFLPEAEFLVLPEPVEPVSARVSVPRFVLAAEPVQGRASLAADEWLVAGAAQAGPVVPRVVDERLVVPVAYVPVQPVVLAPAERLSALAQQLGVLVLAQVLPPVP
jgi:hypothetical protein